MKKQDTAKVISELEFKVRAGLTEEEQYILDNNDFSSLAVEIYNPNEVKVVQVDKKDLLNTLNWGKKAQKLIKLFNQKSELELSFKEAVKNMKDDYKESIRKIDDEILEALQEEQGHRTSASYSQKKLFEQI